MNDKETLKRIEYELKDIDTQEISEHFVHEFMGLIDQIDLNITTKEDCSLNSLFNKADKIMSEFEKINHIRKLIYTIASLKLIIENRNN